MSKLPTLSGRECAAALLKAGFYLKRQHGSHLILRGDDPFVRVAYFTDTTKRGEVLWTRK